MKQMFAVCLLLGGGYNEQTITMFTLALDSPPTLLLHVFYIWGGMQRRECRSLLLACKHGEAVYS